MPQKFDFLIRSRLGLGSRLTAWARCWRNSTAMRLAWRGSAWAETRSGAGVLARDMTSKQGAGTTAAQEQGRGSIEHGGAGAQAWCRDEATRRLRLAGTRLDQVSVEHDQLGSARREQGQQLALPWGRYGDAGGAARLGGRLLRLRCRRSV